jgi:NAD(P)-dependent dehydrogenase (short-subunit alcohol dehydrogenase family)
VRLKDKVAIVTGAARGIGAGIARCLAAEGARVGVVDIDGPGAESTAASLGVEAVGLGADCSQEAGMHTATEAIVARLGRLDILVNNAGAGPPALPTVLSPFMALDQAAWDQWLASNLRTTFASTKAAIPHLQSGGAGAIVNIASIAALIPAVALPAYGAAKAGVVALTRTLALELAASNIRVNAICPGFLWTRVWETMATEMKTVTPDYANLTPREIFDAAVQRSTPLGREQTPEDIGRLTVFLTSDEAANITGQVIAVDGGITLKNAAS